MVHPGLGPPGGGEGLAAWLLQALVESGRYDPVLVSLRPPDLPGLNRYFGTSLREEDVRVVLAPAWIRALVRLWPTRGALLEMVLLERAARRLGERIHPDLYLTTCNEVGFPRPGLQYIHYPRYHHLRGVGDYRWHHSIPGLLRGYRAVCRALVDYGALSRNLSLANSAFTARAFREVHDGPVEVLHPPVPGEAPEPVLWEARANRFVCVGRIAPEKRIPRVVEIVRRVRARMEATGEAAEDGASAPGLVLAGAWDCPPGLRSEVEALLERHAEWLELRQSPSREELDALLADSRYGIHGMVDEHFGMAVAELQRAGSVTFVPVTGGPKEIIGPEATPQLYASPAEAVEKIVAVLRDEVLQRRLHQRALARSGLFTTERFQKGFLAKIEAMLA